jgi:hypothetical protein
MKRLMLLIAAAALVLAAALPTTASAGHTPRPPLPPEAKLVPLVQTVKDGTARVAAAYTCPEGVHLWVSAKQSADGKKDPRLEGEGSSALAAAWLQSHPAPSTFRCDGRWHVGVFKIDTAEQGFGKLRRGVAWVQFCLIGETTFISESRWALVR